MIVLKYSRRKKRNVIHNVTTVDKLAIKIAQIEKIPLLVTKLDIEEVYKRLSKL